MSPLKPGIIVDRSLLWSAPASFLLSQWNGCEELLNRRTGIAGTASFNHLVQYCVLRGMARSERFHGFSVTASSDVNTPDGQTPDESETGQISIPFPGVNSQEVANEHRVSTHQITRVSIDYEYSFLRKVVIENYSNLHALAPLDFSRHCQDYPFKTSLRQSLSSLEQLKKNEDFGGYDTRCEIQPLSFPELVSTRFVCQQWSESETRPFESLIKSLFEYSILIGVSGARCKISQSR